MLIYVIGCLVSLGLYIYIDHKMNLHYGVCSKEDVMLGASLIMVFSWLGVAATLFWNYFIADYDYLGEKHE